jgi:hypothetical protein
MDNVNNVNNMDVENLKNLLGFHFKLSSGDKEKTEIKSVIKKTFDVKTTSKVYIGKYEYFTDSVIKITPVSADSIDYKSLLINSSIDIPLEISPRGCEHCNSTGIIIKLFKQENFLMTEIYEKCLHCNDTGVIYNVKYLKIYKYALHDYEFIFSDKNQKESTIICNFFKPLYKSKHLQVRSESDKELETVVDLTSHNYYLVDCKFKSKLFTFIKIRKNTIIIDCNPYSFFGNLLSF